MNDHRLVATNPENSTLVPVSCNSRGELNTVAPKIEEIPNDLNIDGDLTIGGTSASPNITLNADGSVSLDGNFATSGLITGRDYVARRLDNDSIELWRGIRADGTYSSRIYGNGSAIFAGTVESQQSSAGVDLFKGGYSSSTGTFVVRGNGTIVGNENGGASAGNYTYKIDSNGSARFAGDVVIGSRGKSWMLVEQGGLCHLVEQPSSLIDEGFSVDHDYPKLRDVFNELDLIERSLSQVMEKLRLTPPTGWPVWDGSDETQ